MTLQTNVSLTNSSCGASSGNSAAHLAAARALAETLHKHNYRLVYGGGTKGVMGTVGGTLASLAGPDAVHGIIPGALVDNEAHQPSQGSTSQAQSQKAPEATASEISENKFGKTTVVSSMHERKELMAREVSEGGPGSGFVGLSGGYGTMEEVMEMVTWNQLGIHNNPVVLLNVEGYWDALLEWVQHANKTGFITAQNVQILKSADTAGTVIETLKSYEPSEDRLKLAWGSS